MLIIFDKSTGKIDYTVEKKYDKNFIKKKNNQDIIITDNEKVRSNKHFINNSNNIELKKDLKIKVNKNKIYSGSDVVVNIEVLDDNNFSSINMKINDVEFVVDIENNQGSKEIQLDEPDEYIVRCNDHRFKSQPVEVEVV